MSTFRLTAVMLWALCSTSLLRAGDPMVEELFRAKTLEAGKYEEELGRDVLGRSWDFSRPDRGNFTLFSADVKELAAGPDGSLRFRAGDKELLIGWGNYGGSQPVSDRVGLWARERSGGSTIELAVRQSADAESIWRLRLWTDGERQPDAVTAGLQGTKLQTLRFKIAPAIAPDGFELEIEGPEGNQIDLVSLRFFRDVYEGHYRKTFDLNPAWGGVWRAVADVCRWAAWDGLFVNGQEVPLTNSILQPPDSGANMYQTVAVDLAPYLRPGRNCIALRGKRVGYPPFVYSQGQIVLTSGEIIRIDTDDTWRWSPQPAEGWMEPEFDDAGWQVPRLGDPHYAYLQNSLPAYDGRIVLESPDDTKLFFEAGKPVRARARVPGGLEPKKPTLRWALRQVDYQRDQERARGQVDRFTRSGESLVYELDCGDLERGVYTLQVSLEADGQVIESRPREPLLVLGRIPMKEVEGTTYEEGMKLALEDTIDFTDSDDPHPWVEGFKQDRRALVEAVSKPRIVRKQGLVYRETGPGRGSFFSYRFALRHPGDFYLMVLEYPNDAERWIGVSCSTSVKGIWTNSKAGPSIWTGDKYPLSNSMQEHRWIFRADDGLHTIDLIVMQEGSPAAARRLRIYHIEELPALAVRGSGGRRLGILTERTTLTSGFAKTFGLDVHQQRPLARAAEGTPAGPVPPLQRRLAALVRNLDACEHYTRYLRFTGQNLHVMGCFQYSETNTPFAPEPMVPMSRVPADLRDTAVRVLGHNGIDVIASIEYAGHRRLAAEYTVNDGQVLAGADTARTVSREGKQYGGKLGGYYGCWNFMHPRVRQMMRMVARDVLAKFQDRPNFRGINWTPYLSGEWLPNFTEVQGEEPLKFSYDDATIRRFEGDTGIRVPIDPKDPRRFEKRYLYLTSPWLKPKWIEWRVEKVRELFLEVRDLVREARPDLDLFVSPYFNVPHARAWSLSTVSDEAGRHPMPLRAFMRRWGYDPAAYRDDEDLWLARWTHATVKYEPLLHRPAYSAGWRQSVDPEFVGAYEGAQRRAVMIMHHWDENTYTAPGAKQVKIDGRQTWQRKMPDGSEWPLPFNRGRLHAQPNGDFAREAFTQALITSDPEQIMFGFMDVNLMVGNEQPLREFARVFRALPCEQFQPVPGTGVGTNLAIRKLRTAEACFLTVANPGIWPIEGVVTLSGAKEVVDLASGRPAGAPDGAGGVNLAVSLRPFGVAAYRTDSPETQVVAWQSKPVQDEHLAHLRSLVARAERRLADPRTRAILVPEELAVMRDSLKTAKDALAEGKYALAWKTVTHWRFWVLLHEYLAKAAGLVAETPLPKESRLPKEAAAAPSIVYEKAARRIVVCGGEESRPVTPSDLIAADRDAGWGVVARDDSSDTTRVNAELIIGREDGSSTYFQVGCPEHPRETLVVKGHLRVAPPAPSPERSDGRPLVINGLQLGDPGNPQINAELKLDCSSPRKFGIHLGYPVEKDGRRTWRGGGSLRVYHSTITAFRQNPQHAFGVCRLVGSEVHLVKSTISWCGDLFAYGINSVKLHRVEHCTFEHCQAVLYNGQQKAEDCIFRNCGTAVQEGGSLSAQLVRCTFRGNDHNFTKTHPGDIVLVDCDAGPQKEPLVLTSGVAPRTRAIVYPTVTSLRTLVVTVVDESERPIAGATADVRCEQEGPEAVVRGFAVTGSDGSTPDATDPSARGLLVTEYRLRATDDPDKQERASFTYTAQVTAAGFAPATLRGIEPRPGQVSRRVILKRVR